MKFSSQQLSTMTAVMHRGNVPTEPVTPPSAVSTESENSNGQSTLHNGRRRLRPWLVGLIDSGKVKGLVWMNQDKTMFKIPWKHAGKQDYDPEEDSKVFKMWSENTGKYKEGINEPEPAVWKTRLRTALNKLPDIEEVTERTQLDIPEPYRVYRLLPKTKPQKPCSRPLNVVPGRRGPGEGHGYHPYHQYSHYTYPGQKQNFFGHGIETGTYPPMGEWNQNHCSPRPYDEQIYHHDKYGRFASTPYTGYPQHNPTDMIDMVHDVILSDVNNGHGQDERNMATQHFPGFQQPPSANHSQMNPYQTNPPNTMASVCTASNPSMSQTFPMNSSHVSYSDEQYPYCPTSEASQILSPISSASCSTFSRNGLVGIHNDVMEAQIPPSACLPQPTEFEVHVYYRSCKVASKHVTSPNGCALYFGEPPEIPGMEKMALPDVASLGQSPATTPKQIQLTNQILDACRKGLTLQMHQDGCLYVTRYCRSALFWSNSLSPNHAEKLERYETVKDTKVFDLNSFRTHLRRYLQNEESSPASPAIYFSVAQKWNAEFPLKNCLISIVIRPLLAYEELRTLNAEAKSLPLSAHSGLLHFSGPDMSVDLEDWETLFNSQQQFPLDASPPSYMYIQNDSP